MEYCELGDLSMFIKKRDKLHTHPATLDLARKYPSVQGAGLNEVVIRHYLKQLASALGFLRSKNYVHRDIKPQNLLLLPSQAFRDLKKLPIMEASQDSLIPVAGLISLPMLKLADFGFARVLPSTSLAETLCGSPLYMAPEILRYERYDAKADLWSVGTVLFEMVTGRPPFRARHHVELLRKIEAAEDAIKFPREAVISSEMKAIIRGLLKRNPVERMSFEAFFTHQAVVQDIPGLVEDDVPVSPKLDSRLTPQPEQLPSSPRVATLRKASHDAANESSPPRSPRTHQPPSPLMGNVPENRKHRKSIDTQRPSLSPREIGEGLGIRRPTGPPHTVSLPNDPRVADRGPREPVQSSLGREFSRNSSTRSPRVTEEEKAAQDVMFERDYVVVEKQQVEVNALADELAANQKVGSLNSVSPRSGLPPRRFTQQGAPNSTTGAVPTPSSRTAMVAQGRGGQDRRNSTDKPLSSSPASTSGAISKAIQDASVRLFGFKISPMLGNKGSSPPAPYKGFPSYPLPGPAGAVGLIGNGKSEQSPNEDVQQAESIEAYATRSDCVYWFAEVKYKQFVPLAPSAQHGLGGVDMEHVAEEDDGLTVEAIVSLSEEALVLYVKSLTLLASAMDIASMWWSKKSRSEQQSGISGVASQAAVQRINSVVQWVRQRFNEILEKSEIVRMKLMDSQRQLPEDHPSHPSNQEANSITSSGGSGFKPVFLTPGISAEKLMYDRALEMSRAAAIDEVTNENLPGCELSYLTAIRMLEAVLDSDEDSLVKRLTAGKEAGKDAVKDTGDLDTEEEAHVRKSKLC